MLEDSQNKATALATTPEHIWEGLEVHNPEGADAACEAVDIATAMNYFKVSPASDLLSS